MEVLLRRLLLSGKMNARLVVIDKTGNVEGAIMATKNTASALNRSQIIFLQELAKMPKGEGLTVLDVEEKTGQNFIVSQIGLGTKEPEQSEEDSLYRLGYIRAEKREEERKIRWVITASGRKVIEKVKTRRVLDGIKVDPDKLDKVVIAFAKTRTYGLELYTDSDLEEIRSKLNGKYQDITLESLRQQMVNRRKQGAFVDPDEKRRRIVEKAIREFGPKGTVLPGLLSRKQMERLEAYGAGDLESMEEEEIEE